MFFVSVAFKGVRVCISHLFSTLTGDPLSVDSKGAYVAPKLCKIWSQVDRTKELVAEIRNAAEKLPQPENRTLTQKVEYQMKYGESRSFWAADQFSITVS